MSLRIELPATATAAEAEAIRRAVEALLSKKPAPAAAPQSGWAGAARREALDDRVH